MKKTLLATSLSIGLAASALSYADYVNMNDVKVDIKQAVDAAMEVVPGKVMDASIDDERGQIVWEVEVMGNDNQKYDVTVDANTGEVINQRLDD